jgi:peptide/nickel transport system permease protein
MRRDLIIKALSNPLALVGFVIIMGILFVAILAPYIAPYDPNAIDVKAILLSTGPVSRYW